MADLFMHSIGNLTVLRGIMFPFVVGIFNYKIWRLKIMPTTRTKITRRVVEITSSSEWSSFHDDSPIHRVVFTIHFLK